MIVDKEEILFNRVLEKLAKKHKNVKPGKMMSAPGIKFKDKVFAFYYDKDMIFRLGKDADPKKLGVKKYHLLNPFKNKAPMKNWFVVPYSEGKNWQKLAEYSLKVITKPLNQNLQITK